MNLTPVICLNLFLAASVNGLECIKCQYNKDQGACSDLSKVGKMSCGIDEVCFKALLYNDIKRPGPDLEKETPKVYRGCRKRNLSKDDEGCAFQKFEPSDAWICLCSDKDYCNGVESFRNFNIFISHHYLVWVIALTVYWISWNI